MTLTPVKGGTLSTGGIAQPWRMRAAMPSRSPRCQGNAETQRKLPAAAGAGLSGRQHPVTLLAGCALAAARPAACPPRIRQAGFASQLGNVSLRGLLGEACRTPRVKVATREFRLPPIPPTGQPAVAPSSGQLGGPYLGSGPPSNWRRSDRFEAWSDRALGDIFAPQRTPELA
jgi:hypothetical protein